MFVHDYLINCIHSMTLNSRKVYILLWRMKNECEEKNCHQLHNSWRIQLYKMLWLKGVNIYRKPFEWHTHIYIIYLWCCYGCWFMENCMCEQSCCCYFLSHQWKWQIIYLLVLFLFRKASFFPFLIGNHSRRCYA